MKFRIQIQFLSKDDETSKVLKNLNEPVKPHQNIS